MEDLIINLEDGKYQYNYFKGVQLVKRYGRDWRNETGDTFLLAMAQRVEELEERLDTATDIIREVVSKNPSTCDSRLVNFLEELEND